ncbi:unnamed protein product [Nippostrongylus brasiliensis]|uniref:DUF4819 domain-containing protein n=1 Tax=Nippostrongylus brasiliensis TaxID=27835 RepID=A0A0N4Y2E5_NIPBR|nr:unnamed protein product [Nippostrongylus brasiliensis]
MEKQEDSPNQVTGPIFPESRRTTVEENEPTAADQEQSPSVSLVEWLGTRVLAQVAGGSYQPGSIKDVHDNKDVVVQFDDGQELRFEDVMNESNSNLIISDQAPSPSLIRSGAMVCVRLATDQNVYRTGELISISATPTKYVVRATSSENESIVSRANLRLLRPPWYDELMAVHESRQNDAGDISVIDPVRPQHLNQY